MKLNKEQKNKFLMKLRNVLKQDIGNEENPQKFHNDIEIGPGGNTASIGINEDFRALVREVVEDVMNEYYPESFSFDEFKEINSYSGKLQYAERNLQKISSGSARTAYKIDDEKVLKVAKNKKGLAQNSEEAEMYKQKYDVIARVFETDDNDYWIEMELAKKISPSRFKQIAGISLEEIGRYLMIRNFNDNRYDEEMKAYEEKYEENDFFTGLNEFIFDYAYPVGDFKRISTYGEVSRDGVPKVVVIDIGASQDVLDTHYSRKNKIRQNQYGGRY